MAARRRPPAVSLVCLVAAISCSAPGGTVAPSGPTTPAATRAESSPIPESVQLSCDDFIDTVHGQQDGYETVLGVVQLPTAPVTRALQTGRIPGPPRRYFAKRGLIVGPDTPFQLTIVDLQALDASLGWGNPGRSGRTLTVDRCRSAQNPRSWLVYAGGFNTARTGCLPLQVSSTTGTRRVQVGVGAPCPGQDPPPQPSDS